MITTALASVPQREGLLEVVVNSLAPQSDQVFVALNGYKEIPKFLLNMPNVKYDLLDNRLGDAAKFYHVAEVDGYYLSCDDDLQYPNGYCQYMISKVKQYNCIITLHGRQYKNRPIRAFKRGWTLNYHCLHTYDYDTELDLGGTGVMAFDTAIFRPKLSEYKVKNMADIWTAKQAHEQGIKIMGVAHKNTFLRYLNPVETIWRSSPDDTVQTSILKTFLK
jgi:hypothetical protein